MGRPVEGGSAQPVHITGTDVVLGGGGDASAANQATEIARLTSILAALGATITTALDAATLAALETVQVGSIPGIAGTIANDAADSGNPVKIGGKASDTTPAAVTAGDRVDARFRTTGEQSVWVENQVQTLPTGAPNYANGQVATSTSAGTLLAARTTRRSVTFVNLDSSITVYIGAATVSAANGFRLKAGESITLNITTLIQAIAASGTPTVAYLEIYD